MLNMNRPKDTKDKNVRFRFAGDENWTIRTRVKNLRAYINSVDKIPTTSESGSQWHVGGEDKKLPECTSWQIKDSNGNWRPVDQNDLAG